MIYSYPTFYQAIVNARHHLKTAPIVHPGRWQGVDVSKAPEAATHEVLNFSFSVASTDCTLTLLQQDILPDLPWADDHFEERVSGKPLNPPPSEEWWPHAPEGNEKFKNAAGKFSHTYPERYWPKYAGLANDHSAYMHGIRYPYGDLSDLVEKLREDPMTRSAYMPVWFPEDLGMPISERKPCSIGYQLIMRDDKLHLIYQIRSCDFFRHFRNDIYMTVRLQHWILEELRSVDDRWFSVDPGSFTMHITSLHLFRNDYIRVFNG